MFNRHHHHHHYNDNCGYQPGFFGPGILPQPLPVPVYGQPVVIGQTPIVCEQPQYIVPGQTIVIRPR